MCENGRMKSRIETGVLEWWSEGEVWNAERGMPAFAMATADERNERAGDVRAGEFALLPEHAIRDTQHALCRFNIAV